MSDQILTQDEVMSAMRYRSRSGFYVFCKCNPEFPKSIPLGLRRVGWVKSEVDAYIARKLAERNTVEG